MILFKKAVKILLGIVFFIIAGYSFYITGICIVWGSMGLKGHISEIITYIGWNSIYFLSSCIGVYAAIRLIKKPFSKLTAILMLISIIPLFNTRILPIISMRTDLAKEKEMPDYKAKKYFSEGMYALSIEEFNKSQSLTGQGKPYQELITAYIKNNNFDGGLKICNEYIQNSSKGRGYQYAYPIRAGLYFWQGNYALAIDDYQRIISLARGKMHSLPITDRLLISIANCHAKMGEYDLALDNFNKAIETIQKQLRYGKSNPTVNAKAILYRGDYFLWRKEFEKAMLDYNRVIEINDKSFLDAAYARRANLFMLMGDYNSAIEDLNQIVPKNLDYIIPRIDKWRKVRGALYMKLGMHEEAKRDKSKYKEYLNATYSNRLSSLLWSEIDKVRRIPPLIEIFENIGNE